MGVASGMRECKLLHIRYNLFAGTEMLSLSVYEPIAKQILLGETVPQFRGGGRARGSGVAPCKSSFAIGS